MTPLIDSALSPLSKFSRWMTTRWEAHRAHQKEEMAIDVLRTMDPKLVNDIGVDITKLAPPEPPERKMQDIVTPLRGRHHDPL